MENIINQFQVAFKSQFPNSPSNVSNSVVGRPVKFIGFALAQKSDYNNGIINNDPLYHTIEIIDNLDGTFTAEHLQGALYVNPREQFFASSTVKTRLTKKTGSEKQVITHLTKWINKVKSIVVENKHDIYGGLEKYQKYIIE